MATDEKIISDVRGALERARENGYFEGNFNIEEVAYDMKAYDSGLEAYSYETLIEALMIIKKEEAALT